MHTFVFQLKHKVNSTSYYILVNVSSQPLPVKAIVLSECLCDADNVILCSDYKSDPYSQGDPCKSICCRNDLQEHGASPGGCYDTKVS